MPALVEKSEFLPDLQESAKTFPGILVMAVMKVCTQIIIKDLVDLCSCGLTSSSKAMLPPGCSQPVTKYYLEPGMIVSPFPSIGIFL